MSGHRQFEVFIFVKARGCGYVDSVSPACVAAQERATTIADLYKAAVRVVRFEYRPSTGLYHDQVLFKLGNDQLLRRGDEWLSPHLDDFCGCGSLRARKRVRRSASAGGRGLSAASAV